MGLKKRNESISSFSTPSCPTQPIDVSGSYSYTHVRKHGHNSSSSSSSSDSSYRPVRSYRPPIHQEPIYFATSPIVGTFLTSVDIEAGKCTINKIPITSLTTANLSLGMFIRIAAPKIFAYFEITSIDDDEITLRSLNSYNLHQITIPAGTPIFLT